MRALVAMVALLVSAVSPAADHPGMVVGVTTACRTVADAETVARSTDATIAETVAHLTLSRRCIVTPGVAWPVMLLEHATGPHGDPHGHWWSVWRARVGSVSAFVVVEDRSL